MEKNEFLRILDGDINLINTVNIEALHCPTIEIVVMPEHLKKMLMSYLNSQISAAELTRWTNFICLRGEYVPLNFEDDEMAEYYEEFWDIMQRLSNPEIDGKITPELVLQYLKELEKYK